MSDRLLAWEGWEESFWAKDPSVGFRGHKGTVLLGCTRVYAGWGLTATFGPQGIAGLTMTVMEPGTGRIGC